MRRVSDAVVRTYFNFEVALWSRDGKILAKVLPEGQTLDAIRDQAFGKAKTAEQPKRGAPTVVVYRSGVPDDSASAAAASPEKTGYVNVNRADLALLDPATGALRRVATDVVRAATGSRPDGGELAFTDITGWAENTQQPQYDLYVVRLSDGSRRALGRALNMAYGISVSWSPDGKSLAYVRAGQLTKDQVVGDLGGRRPRDDRRRDAAHRRRLAGHSAALGPARQGGLRARREGARACRGGCARDPRLCSRRPTAIR